MCDEDLAVVRYIVVGMLALVLIGAVGCNVENWLRFSNGYCPTVLLGQESVHWTKCETLK